MKKRRTTLALLCFLFAARGQFAGAQTSGMAAASAEPSFSRISKEEVELLIADTVKANPKLLKAFADDPAMKKQQLDNLKQLLAFASQAQKEGLSSDPVNRQELENIRSEVVAVNYDKEINKNKSPMPPFGFITEASVKAFWGTGETTKVREADFKKFLDSKLALLKNGNSQMQRQGVSDEEITQARDFFARIEIYESEYEQRSAAFPKAFRDRIELQVKLQQAQFLSRLYSERLAERVTVTDADVAKYISERPELNMSEKRARAEKILARAKAGEDFAKLANEFSEDPGNKGSGGKLLGGLYTQVPAGRMVAPFERAALSLEAGQISPAVVETDFGFHIIKLDRKGKNPAVPGTQIYDVRHILISTTFKDPADPNAAEGPIKIYVRSKLEAEKEKWVVEEIIAANSIQVPDDFIIPATGSNAVAAKKAKRPMKKRPVKKRR